MFWQHIIFQLCKTKGGWEGSQAGLTSSVPAWVCLRATPSHGAHQAPPALPGVLRTPPKELDPDLAGQPGTEGPSYWTADNHREVLEDCKKGQHPEPREIRQSRNTSPLRVQVRVPESQWSGLRSLDCCEQVKSPALALKHESSPSFLTWTQHKTLPSVGSQILLASLVSSSQLFWGVPKGFTKYCKWWPFSSSSVLGGICRGCLHSLKVGPSLSAGAEAPPGPTATSNPQAVTGSWPFPPFPGHWQAPGIKSMLWFKYSSNHVPSISTLLLNLEELYKYVRNQSVVSDLTVLHIYVFSLVYATCTHVKWVDFHIVKCQPLLRFA